jgi:hypothetical protein
MSNATDPIDAVGAPGRMQWQEDGWIYDISDEKKARLQLKFPTDKTELRAYYMQHADIIIKKKHKPSPVVRAGETAQISGSDSVPASDKDEQSKQAAGKEE